MIIRRTALMLVLGLSFLSGCYSLQTAISDDMIAMRNYREARGAWASCRGIYIDCEPNLYDFGLGFRAGYENIAGGGSGCPPTLPPQRYWQARYQDDLGREQVVAWYNGFSHGVEVALSDGVGNRNHIVTSQELYPQCRTATQVELPVPHEAGLDPMLYGEMDGGGAGMMLPTPQSPELNPPPADLY